MQGPDWGRTLSQRCNLYLLVQADQQEALPERQPQQELAAAEEQAVEPAQSRIKPPHSVSSSPAMLVALAAMALTLVVWAGKARVPNLDLTPPEGLAEVQQRFMQLAQALQQLSSAVGKLDAAQAAISAQVSSFSQQQQGQAVSDGILTAQLQAEVQREVAKAMAVAAADKTVRT
jgi:hypothetical protein